MITARARHQSLADRMWAELRDLRERFAHLAEHPEEAEPAEVGVLACTVAGELSRRLVEVIEDEQDGTEQP